MTAVVIGASGHIGELLMAELRRCGENVIGTFAETPMPRGVRYHLGEDRPESVLQDLSPDDVVYLLSAISSPDAVLLDPAHAMRVNVLGAIELLDFVQQRGARAVFMSSVEVFDGGRPSYAEHDQPNPLNIYGLTKWRVEQYILDILPANRFTIVRTGWNIGPTMRSRCVVRLTYDALMQPGARMATDNLFSVISTIDTAMVLYNIGQNALETPAIVHVSGDDVIVRSELASKIMAVSRNSAQMGFANTTFARLNFREPRGRMNVLNNSLSKSVLGAKYRPGWDAIDAKIRLIDSNTGGRE